MALAHTRLLSVISVLGLTGVFGASCGPDDKFPLPDEFDAAFVTGSVCMPRQIQTATTAPGAPSYPVRFETCVYRCIELERSTVTFRNSWSCLGPQCDMLLLLTSHVTRVEGQEDCDARDLLSPPSSECTPEVFEFMTDPPHTLMEGTDTYLTGDFRVSVPFLDLDQSQQVLLRVNNGESPITAAQAVGVQITPDRQFTVNFDPSHAAVGSHAELQATDCHSIVAPDL